MDMSVSMGDGKLKRSILIRDGEAVVVEEIYVNGKSFWDGSGHPQAINDTDHLNTWMDCARYYFSKKCAVEFQLLSNGIDVDSLPREMKYKIDDLQRRQEIALAEDKKGTPPQKEEDYSDSFARRYAHGLFPSFQPASISPPGNIVKSALGETLSAGEHSSAAIDAAMAAASKKQARIIPDPSGGWLGLNEDILRQNAKLLNLVPSPKAELEQKVEDDLADALDLVPVYRGVGFNPPEAITGYASRKDLEQGIGAARPEHVKSKIRRKKNRKKKSG